MSRCLSAATSTSAPSASALSRDLSYSATKSTSPQGIVVLVLPRGDLLWPAAPEDGPCRGRCLTTRRTACFRCTLSPTRRPRWNASTPTIPATRFHRECYVDRSIALGASKRPRALGSNWRASGRGGIAGYSIDVSRCVGPCLPTLRPDPEARAPRNKKHAARSAAKLWGARYSYCN